jgi:hypothetical protein
MKEITKYYNKVTNICKFLLISPLFEKARNIGLNPVLFGMDLISQGQFNLG